MWLGGITAYGCSTLLNVAAPYLVGVAIDRYILPGDLPGLARIAALMLAVYAAHSLCAWLQTYIMAGAAQRTVRDLRADLFARLQVLASDAIYRALNLHQTQLIQREQALSLVTSLPCLEQNIIPNAGAQDALLAAVQFATQPTHLLCGHVAQPLLESGTVLAGGGEIYHSNNGWQLRAVDAATRVNSAAYRPGQILASGDVILLNTGDTALLIEVVA